MTIERIAGIALFVAVVVFMVGLIRHALRKSPPLDDVDYDGV